VPFAASRTPWLDPGCPARSQARAARQLAACVRDMKMQKPYQRGGLLERCAAAANIGRVLGRCRRRGAGGVRAHKRAGREGGLGA
jgi:hypothetical protein